jgi:hypothetical protein
MALPPRCWLSTRPGCANTDFGPQDDACLIRSCILIYSYLSISLLRLYVCLYLGNVKGYIGFRLILALLGKVHVQTIRGMPVAGAELTIQGFV